MGRVRWLIEEDETMPSTSRVLAHGVRADRIRPEDLRAGRLPPRVVPTVVYGSMEAVRLLSKHEETREFLFDDHSVLPCTSYYRYVYEFLHRRVVFLPWRALASLDLSVMFGPRVFVRPDANDKPFRARILDAAGIEEFVETFSHNEDRVVVVSEVVDLGTEYRCFTRGGEVFAHSSYPRDPYKPAPEDVLSFAKQVAQRLMEKLDLRMLSVDVAKGPDGLKLVEVGGVNSWGVYGSDVAAWVEAMEAEAVVLQT